MKVVFVSDHFSTPDEPGILRTWQLARYLCEAGDTVTVIAPARHYLFGDRNPGQSRVLPHGMTLVEVRSPPLERQHLRSRIRYYLAQLLGATHQAWRAGRCDVMVSGLTPSVLSLGPYLVARARRIPFVLDERDLALDAIAELGIFPPVAVRAAQAVERTVQRAAELVVTVTPGLVPRLEAHGVPSHRIRLVPNGYEGDLGTSSDASSLRRQLGWEGRFVLLYAGALGQAYDVGLVLDALNHVRCPDVLFAIAGEGERKAEYKARAQVEKLPVEFLDSRPKSAVPGLCAAADVCVLPLHPVAWSACSLSNKLFDYLGAGTPVVTTGPGDSADLVSAAHAGLTVTAGDAVAFGSAIDTLASDPAGRVSMGEAGRAFVQAHWRRELFTPLFRRALLAVTDPASEPFRERELARIRGVYGYYDATPREQRKRNMSNPGTRAHADSRWAAIREELLRQPPQRGAAILDVGCGGGADLARLAQLFNGSRPELHGVDVLPDRIERAREAVPEASFMLEPADQLPFADDHFHVILASTLFSSLVDDAYACSVAAELIRVLEPGGRLVCYDVRYPNPTNPHTRAMSHRRLRRLFPEPLVLERLQSVTLLPPLARRLGRLTRIAYAPLHRIPPLRSHYLAVVTKPEASPTMVNSA